MYKIAFVMKEIFEEKKLKRIENDYIMYLPNLVFIHSFLLSFESETMLTKQQNSFFFFFLIWKLYSIN